MNENPLLDCNPFPKFGHIKPEHILPALKTVLATGRAEVERLSHLQNPTWDNFVEPLEALDDRLERLWSPVSHLNSVQDTEALRSAVKQALPLLTQYAAEMGQNQCLYSHFNALKQSAAYADMSLAKQAVITNQLRDFKLSGVALSANKQAKYKKLSRVLAELSQQYQQNVLDATQAWTLHLTDPADLAGLPDSAIAAAKNAAQKDGMDGWQFSLQAPSFIPFMTYADNPALREQMYTAFTTRASDQGPHAGRWDNSDIMAKIIAKRQQLAQLLGFESYAQYSLETKMAEEVAQVETFLLDLGQRSKTSAIQEDVALQAFAKKQHGIKALQPWDRSYYAEKLKVEQYAFSEEELRVYFPLPTVLTGLFKTVEKLFAVQVREAAPPPVWHQDVQFFEIYDQDDSLRGCFYLDLYARDNKHGGAWMADCAQRRVTAEINQKPVAFLNCNFPAASENSPALLRHDDVITLFHEFGHGLHHMLTKVDIASVSGINGVPWDAVELPSQFLENWCWQREALDLISGHVDTGEPLPDALLDKMLKAKNFHAALQMLRQVEFSLFDIRLHNACAKVDIQTTLEQVRAEIAVTQTPAFNRFAHGFSHIFAGGYAAGYYGYKWAEVLSADAFSCFEEEGLFNPATGQRFLTCILEQGGSQDPATLFAQFRGRPPSIEALLKHCGLH